MKKVLILHGTGGNSRGEWFPWLKTELERKGSWVWAPDLPGAQEPDINTYNEFIFENCPFGFDRETVIIGHSSGAVAAFGLVQMLHGPVEQLISVAGFVDDLNYDPVKKMFATWNFDWEKVRLGSRRITIIYSDDDPFVPKKHAVKLQNLLKAKSIMMPGQKHFSVLTFPKYTKFPELLKLI